jgi:hypothetical protein
LNLALGLPFELKILQGATMADQPNDSANKSRDNAAPADSDTAKRESGHTKSGQEPMRGVSPGAHNDEHQSNYGGGGTNGGNKDATR